MVNKLFSTNCFILITLNRKYFDLLCAYPLLLSISRSISLSPQSNALLFHTNFLKVILDFLSLSKRGKYETGLSMCWGLLFCFQGPGKIPYLIITSHLFPLIIKLKRKLLCCFYNQGESAQNENESFSFFVTFFFFH